MDIFYVIIGIAIPVGLACAFVFFIANLWPYTLNSKRLSTTRFREIRKLELFKENIIWTRIKSIGRKIRIIFFIFVGIAIVSSIVVDFYNYINSIKPTPIHLIISKNSDQKEKILGKFLMLIEENKSEKFADHFLQNCPRNYNGFLCAQSTTQLCKEIIKICLKEAILKNNLEIVKVILSRGYTSHPRGNGQYPEELYTRLSYPSFGAAFGITKGGLKYKQCSIDLDDPLNDEMEDFIEALLFAAQNQRIEIINFFKNYIASKKPEDRKTKNLREWYCLNTHIQKALLQIESMQNIKD